jgi:acyl-coenzyme A synthetase/AMP-(fatty) acid ligase
MRGAIATSTSTSPWTASRLAELLLAGDPARECLTLGRPVERAELSRLVAEQAAALRAAGLAEGGTLALRLPPSLAFVAALLAGWSCGAQVSLLDHRLTEAEAQRALERVGAQVVVTGADVVASKLRGYAEARAVAAPRSAGRPAQTDHALVQLSSGSTGASKVIARTAADLHDELERYRALADPAFPGAGERMVVLASVVHVLGLVGGLLHCLADGVPLAFAERLTGEGILATVAADPRPTTVLGVPFHAELLAAADARAANLAGAIVAGELVRPGLPAQFRDRLGVPLGTMYGMTEVGVIATDLDGSRYPSVLPCVAVRAVAGELQVRRESSPYLGLSDPTRWADGWLHTRDAATIDPATGEVTIRGRLDSQVSIGGLKVDLTEVEQTLAALPQVADVVVLHDDGIEAYLALVPGGRRDAVEAAIVRELAAFKRPRRLRVLTALPRTATNKVVRDLAVLRRAAAEESGEEARPAPGRDSR